MTLAPFDPILLAPLAAFGLVFGSFTTALSYRLPRGESVAKGRSRCPACGHTLTASDLVPVLSWVAHGGKCRHCGVKISGRYPAIELTTMALFIGAGLLSRDVEHLLIILAMTPVMMALAIIDLEHQRLPNVLIGVLAALSLAWRACGDRDFGTAALIAAAAGGGGMLLSAGYKALTKKDGLGMGDTKLYAIAGFALAIGPYLIFAALAALLGVVFGALWMWRRQTSQFPFAPTILAAYWLCLMLGNEWFNRLVILRTG
jgi:leader peptidase (prepilin peptidase)/N-methyltransferase